MKKKILKGYLASQEGDAVGEQFYRTFGYSSPNFNDCNSNALEYIRDYLKEILRDSPFFDDTDINEYLEKMDKYLNETKGE